MNNVCHPARRIRYVVIAAALSLTSLLVGAPSVVAQSGAGFSLDWFTVKSGGATISGGGYMLSATVGQPDAGQRTDFGYRLSGGFLFGNVTPPAAGDCNFDGIVNAGDLSALVLEIFDGDPSSAGSTAGGTFPGSGGCNANGDAVIDAGDLSCTVRRILSGSATCTP